MNKAILIGRLGKDAEVMNYDNGVVKCTMSLATSEYRKNKETGERKEFTEWHNVVAWGRQAEICGKYCKKGMQLSVEGKITSNKWEKDGVKHSTTIIEARSIEFLSSAGVSQQQSGNVQQPQQDSYVDSQFGDVDEGLPF